MPLRVLGVSHKTAPLELRERLAVLPAAALYERLKHAGHSEAVLLSTCNRFELYWRGESASPRGLVEELSGASLDGRSYEKGGLEAVIHLFEVASGLDSLVVGETEVLGQVKNAYEAAKSAGMTGKYTNVLFQRALFTGKKVRNDTGIAVGQTSVASVAVELAERIFGDLSDSSVLVLGAGTMAELAVRHLLSKKVPRLLIANRTRAKAAELASRFKGSDLAWEEFPEALASADIVVSSTGSTEPVLTRGMVAPRLRARAGRSLFIIDIAMPRDVEEGVHSLDHVYLYRLEDLEAIVAENMRTRGGEVEKARTLARGLAGEFGAWNDSVREGRERSLKHAV